MNYREKQQALENLNRYAQSDKPDMSLGQYKRLSSWLNGMSYAEIAEEEGVSTQAIAQSCKRELAKVQAFAQSNDK